MTDRDLFEGEPSDTSERIMRATFETLRQHGYAGLSLGRIADESELSKASIYHFYDDKEDLLVSFLAFMTDRWQTEFAPPATDDPVEDLRTHLVYGVTGRPYECDRPETAAFFGPFVEFRAQAVRNPAYRELFTDLDAVFVDELAAIIRRGVEQGAFREGDPHRQAEFLVTLLMGAVMRRTTVDGLDTDALLDETWTVVEGYLIA